MLKLSKSTRIFSPANSRAILDNLAYRKVIEFWTNAGYALRYSGSLSADIYHMFIKGEGVYCSLGSKLQKKKLRILYECAPLAFLIEKAGGLSSNGEVSILDIIVDGYYQKTDLIVGSKEEVQRVQRFVIAEKKKRKILNSSAGGEGTELNSGIDSENMASKKKYRIQEKKTEKEEEEEGDDVYF